MQLIVDLPHFIQQAVQFILINSCKELKTKFCHFSKKGAKSLELGLATWLLTKVKWLSYFVFVFVSG